MNFLPNPGKYNKKDFNNSLENYFRQIMLRTHFKNDKENRYWLPLKIEKISLYLKPRKAAWW